MRRFFLAACPACLLLSGCVLWEHPIAPPEDAQYDDRLTGDWMLIDENGEVIKPEGFFSVMQFAPAGDGVPKDFLAITGDILEDDGSISQGTVVAYTAQVDDAWYIITTYEGICMSKAGLWFEEPSAYCVGRYEIVDDELLIYGVGGEGFKSAVQNGELMGGDYESGSPFASLNAPTQAIQEYIAAGHEIFVERPSLRLRRVE